jgi:aminopeptidase N
VTTKDFIAVAEQVSGQQLSAFFTTWLYAPAAPPPLLPTQ